MRRVVLDFDGVISAFIHPWEGADVITDDAVPGALDAIQAYQHAGFSVAIHSSRSGQFGGIAAMKSWLYGQLLIHFAPESEVATRILNAIEWPTELLPAVLYVNDRGFHFEGTFPSVEYLNAFRPWNKL